MTWSRGHGLNTDPTGTSNTHGVDSGAPGEHIIVPENGEKK